MLKVRVTYEGLKEARANVEGVKSVLSDFSKELRETGEFLKSWYTVFPFQSQGAVFGSPWDPLKPGYSKAKQKKFGSQPILVATGAMRKKFVYENTSHLLHVMNEASYFPYHQLGAPRANIPARAALQLNENLINTFTAQIMSSVTARIAKYL